MDAAHSVLLAGRGRVRFAPMGERTLSARREGVNHACLNSRKAALSLGGALRQALDDRAELLEGVVGLAVLPGRVAGEDALEDDRQLPVAQRDVEVELGEV